MPVTVLAIDQLHLDDAFLEGTFCPFNDCWFLTKDKSIYVIDDDITKFSRFSNSSEEEQKSLLVINENYREIVLIAIDNKLIRNHPGGIADCALLDEKQLRFVEFKTNAEGNSDEAIHKTYLKAIEQLKETIKLFRARLLNVGIQMDTVVNIKKCHIVTSHSFPKRRAMIQNYQILFANDAETEGMRLDFAHTTYWDKKNA